MKIKRQKRVQKILGFFKTNFGHREPYQLMVDGTFCQGCLTHKINIREQIPKYLGGEVKFLTTPCCIKEIDKLLPSLYGASKILKTFPVHKCDHEGDPKPAMKCLKSMLSKESSQRYLVATQDPELRDKLRKVPGVPLIYLHGNTPILEEPSGTSFEKSEKVINERLTDSYHFKVIEHLKDKEFGPKNNVIKKKRKKKGPNPLSCLKSKKKTGPNQMHGISSSSTNVDKKQRIRKRKKSAVPID